MQCKSLCDVVPLKAKVEWRADVGSNVCFRIQLRLLQLNANTQTDTDRDRVRDRDNQRQTHTLVIWLTTCWATRDLAIETKITRSIAGIQQVLHLAPPTQHRGPESPCLSPHLSRNGNRSGFPVTLGSPFRKALSALRSGGAARHNRSSASPRARSPGPAGEDSRLGSAPSHFADAKSHSLRA